MPFHQLAEALQDLEQLHGRLAISYSEVAEQIGDSDSGRLCQLIADQERLVRSTLEDFRQTAPEDLLNAWLQYMPTADVPRLERSSAPGAVDFEAIVEKAVRTNEELRKLYRQLAGAIAAPRVRELFLNIEQMQLAKISQVATSTLEGELVDSPR